MKPEATHILVNGETVPDYKDRCKKHRFRHPLVLLLLISGILAFVFLSSSRHGPSAHKALGPAISTAHPSSAAAVVPAGRGRRVLVLDINEPSDRNYAAAFQTAVSVGVQEVGLSFDWDTLESQPGKYDDRIISIANKFYPVMKMPINLTLRPISTNRKTTPKDLTNAAFDDPKMIRRFCALIDWVLAQTDKCDVRSLVLGSEVDIYLGRDKGLMREYATLYKVARDHVKKKHPRMLVAVEITGDGIIGDQRQYYQMLNRESDVIGVSWYSVNGQMIAKDPKYVHEFFDSVTALYRGKPIYFYQFGCPSGKLVKSSEALQAQFIREAFGAWDSHKDQILMLDFTFMHDASPSTLDEWERYYGWKDKRFRDFLGTLGLRTFDGKPKEAWNALREEAKARGW